MRYNMKICVIVYEEQNVLDRMQLDDRPANGNGRLYTGVKRFENERQKAIWVNSLIKIN
jgi:hypothetical protein